MTTNNNKKMSGLFFFPLLFTQFARVSVCILSLEELGLYEGSLCPPVLHAGICRYLDALADRHMCRYSVQSMCALCMDYN